MPFKKLVTRPVKGLAFFVAGALVTIPVIVVAGAANFPLSGKVSASVLSGYFGGLDDRLNSVEAWKASWDQSGGIPAGRASVNLLGAFLSSAEVVGDIGAGGQMYNTVASCPATHFPISGSCHGEIAGQPGRAQVMSSIMAEDINGWRCFFNNTGSATARVSARVHCMKKTIP